MSNALDIFGIFSIIWNLEKKLQTKGPIFTFPTMIIYGVSRQRHWTRRRFMIATESFDVNFQVSNGIERLPFIFLWNKNHTKLFLDNEEKWTGKKKTNWFTQSLLGSQKLRVPVGESQQDLKTSSFLLFDWGQP